MAIHSLSFAGHPASLNQLLQSVRARISLKKRDRAQITIAARMAGIPMAEQKRRVTISIVLEKGQRACDPDAYHKSVGDALKQAGMIVNDSYKWIEWAPTQYFQGKRAETTISLEDI